MARVSKCLNCGNEKISEKAQYCRECGKPVVNSCTNRDCEADADVDAKYCELCGYPTTFKEAGLFGPSSDSAADEADDIEIPF